MLGGGECGKRKVINPLSATVAHIETNDLICIANQLTGFCMRATLAFNGLEYSPLPFSRDKLELTKNVIKELIFFKAVKN